MRNITDAAIMLVDDNEELLRLLVNTLKHENYQNIYQAADCESARTIFRRQHLDFIILDVMLPDGDGFSLMREFRLYKEIPVLFLSARDEDRDRLMGLGLGADDYITKPFLMQELLLRIQAILRRTFAWSEQEPRQNVVLLGSSKVDFSSAVIANPRGEFTLTAKELSLMKKLYENRGNIVTFDTLCETIWGDGYYGYENTLMVHIRHLREKLEDDPSNPKWLLTVRGLGYKLAREGKTSA